MKKILDEELSKFCISDDELLIQAMKKMNENGQRILFVTSDDNSFKGVLSAGDIRRFIVQSGGKLKCTIKDIYNKRALSVQTDTPKQAIQEMMINNELTVFPIVDHQNKLCGKVLWVDIFGDKKPLKKDLDGITVVLMAGGIGSRMKPFTNILPKPLLPLNEKPVVEVIMDRYHEFGVDNFQMVVNFKKGMIISYFENTGTPYDISFIDEETLLGTCGGLTKIPSDQLSDHFFLTNCDSLIEADFSDIYKFHIENKNDITLVCTVRDFTIPYGVIELTEEGLIDDIIEKPSFNFLVNTGMYILKKEVIDLIPKNKPYGTPSLIKEVIKQGGRTSIFPLEANARLDTGQWDEYYNTLNVVNRGSVLK